MNSESPLFKARFYILFTVFSFGAGLILVSATQNNTEGRSKASGIDPYITPLECGSGHSTINGNCYPNVEYMQLRAKDPRCNGTGNSSPCPYPIVSLSPSDQAAYENTLPPCTPAKKFSNILCKE